MKKKKLISFDLDQTLVDTIKSHMKAYIEVFKKNNLKLPSEKRLRSLIDGRHGNDVLNALYPHLTKKIKDKIREDRKIILKKYAHLMKPIPGIKKALDVLNKDYSLILVTNAERNEVELFLKRSKINPKIFDLIVLARKHPKPMPDGIIKAEHLLHAKSDIHVGDSVYDILAAKNAKAVSVAVLTGQATRKTIEKYHPDYILKSVAELPKLLKDKKFD